MYPPLSVLFGAAQGIACVYIRLVEVSQVSAIPVFIVNSICDELSSPNRHTRRRKIPAAQFRLAGSRLAGRGETRERRPPSA